MWGIELSPFYPAGKPHLVGGWWVNGLGGDPYPGEPPRALVFCTRAQARAWCVETMATWATSADPSVRKWRVRPVRVRETVARV